MSSLQQIIWVSFLQFKTLIILCCSSFVDILSIVVCKAFHSTIDVFLFAECTNVVFLVKSFSSAPPLNIYVSPNPDLRDEK